jgi:hypothetical protein
MWFPYYICRGSRGHDQMVVGFTTTCAISAYHHHGKVNSILHYVIWFVSDLWQVGGFPQNIVSSTNIKLTTTI